jgi:hypothetical protein
VDRYRQLAKQSPGPSGANWFADQYVRLPASVGKVFMDQMTPAAVLAAADEPDPTRKKSQVWEANFCSGKLSSTNGLKEEATPLFRLAASDCPRGFNEWLAANTEPKAPGLVP